MDSQQQHQLPAKHIGSLVIWNLLITLVGITLGKTSNSNVLLVVHTYVEYNSNQTSIRIISARKASNKEKIFYQNRDV